MRFNEIDDNIVDLCKKSEILIKQQCDEFAFQDSGESLLALMSNSLAYITSWPDAPMVTPDQAILVYAQRGMLAHFHEIAKTEPRGEYESN